MQLPQFRKLCRSLHKGTDAGAKNPPPIVIMSIISISELTDMNARSILPMVIGGVAGAVMLFGVVELRCARAQVPPSDNDENHSSLPTPPFSSTPQVTITGGDSVVSIGQIGSITARTDPIDPPLEPEFRITYKTDVENRDGSHTVTVVGEVASPVNPGFLTFELHANGMTTASVMAGPVGGVPMTQFRNEQRHPEFFSADIPNPRGQYVIKIETAGPSNVDLKAYF